MAIKEKSKNPILLSLNMMLGAGIFVLSVLSVSRYSGAAVSHWFVAGIIALILSFVFRAGIKMSKEKDIHRLIETVYGKRIAKTTDWLYWVGSAFVISAIGMIISQFAVKTFILSPDYIAPVAVGFVILSYVFEILQNSSINYFLKFTVVLKVLILAIFLIVASQSAINVDLKDLTAIQPLGIILAFWAYMGFENLSISAKERYIPILQSSLILSTTIVFTLIVAFITAIPSNVVKSSLTLVDLTFPYVSPIFLSFLVVIFSAMLLSVAASSVRNTYDKIKVPNVMLYQMLLAVLAVFVYRNFVNLVLASAYLYIFYYFIICATVMRQSYRDRRHRFFTESLFGLASVVFLFSGIQIASFLTLIAALVSGRIYAK